MSKKLIYSLKVKQDGEILELLFSNNGGSFGTDEILDQYELTNLSLLEILQKHFEESEN